ncbi:MAG: TolC family protein [Gemmatimonadaceae bacterium]|jgi:outer membrane protein TolC|nr:TolC family protein [Gemmatimonadaceae bacterium]
MRAHTAATPAAYGVALIATLVGVRTQAQPTDSLSLTALYRLAEQADKRAPQLDLLAEQSAQRTITLRREALPVIGGTALAQYLSDVPQVRLPGPGGAAGIGPANEQVDTYLSVRQSLYDPTRAARSRVERAQLAESQASVRGTIWAQRQQVNDAFFALAQGAMQQRHIEASLVDLTERRRIAVLRRDNGVALASEVALLDAELARRRQALAELAATQAATRDVLASMVGRPVTERNTPVIPPTLARDTMPLPDAGRDRLEFAQFARSRDLLAAREQLATRALLPRLSAVARTGYGRPGINPLRADFVAYSVLGMQLEWAPWNWGATQRDLAVTALQARLVATSESQLEASIARAARADRGRIEALERMRADDDTIVALREAILRETRLRFDEQDIGAAEFVARSVELLTATLDRETRRIRLAEARARYFTTIGRDLP